MAIGYKVKMSRDVNPFLWIVSFAPSLPPSSLPFFLISYVLALPFCLHTYIRHLFHARYCSAHWREQSNILLSWSLHSSGRETKQTSERKRGRKEIQRVFSAVREIIKWRRVCGKREVAQMTWQADATQPPPATVLPSSCLLQLALFTQLGGISALSELSFWICGT